MRKQVLTGLSFLACLCAFSGCSVFDMNEYDSFADWYVGPPGMTRMMSGDSDAELTARRQGLLGDRPPIYGHFRLPEVLFQPKGGLRYPARRTTTTDTLFNALDAHNKAAPGTTYTFGSTTINTDAATNSIRFDLLDAGLVEIVPYRTWFSDESTAFKAGMTLASPLTWLITASGTFLRIPAYAVHDVVKLAMTPVAALYYSNHIPDDAAETASR